jgi:hypothetical protein
MRVIITDGGRAKAGFFSASSGDCVARSIAIASGRPYAEVYDRLAVGNGKQRRSKRTGKRGITASNGINTNRKWFKDYMADLGFEWTPTMAIGSGCKVHLRNGEVPSRGRYVVSLSKHFTALIDGVVFDTYDPSRFGTRCVYGYWKLRESP